MASSKYIVSLGPGDTSPRDSNGLIMVNGSKQGYRVADEHNGNGICCIKTSRARDATPSYDSGFLLL